MADIQDQREHVTFWEVMRRLLHVAQDSFDSFLRTVSGMISGDDLVCVDGKDDPRHLRSLAKQVAFTIAVIGLSAKMARADGLVRPSEVTAFYDIVHVPAGEERNVARVFDLARQDVAGYEGYARQIAKLFQDKPGVLEDLLDGLFHIAKADGVVHPLEVDFLSRVADIFGFSPSHFEQICCSHVGCPESDPYAILGVSRDITDEELKRVYRRLVKDNHPDALIARGVPPEFVGLANGKISLINTAYERIKHQRARQPVPA